MTAINVAISPDGRMGVMLTDTAGLDEDGIVTEWAAKVITLPHMGCVVAARGLRDTLIWAADQVAAFWDFDGAVAGGQKYFAEHWPEMRDRYPGFGCEVFMLGWSSDRGALEAYSASDRDNFRLQRIHGIWLAPMPEQDALVAAGLLVPGKGMKMSVIGDDLLRVMEIQRTEVAPCNVLSPERGIGYNIGGAAVLTIVMPGGQITQKVIHRWAGDMIGEKINTARPPPL